MSNEIAVIKQLPKIEESIKKVSEELDSRLAKMKLDKLVASEETKQSLKDLRTQLGKEYEGYDLQRKYVKNELEKPYKEFEIPFNELIKEKYINANIILTEKINEVEDAQKEEIKKLCVELFEEYAASKNIDFVKFEQLNMKINLSLATPTGNLTSKTKNEITGFIDKIEDDLKLIDMQNKNEEILIEYKKDLNVSRAISEVINRYKELEQMKVQKEENKQQEISDTKMLNKINELSAPVEEKPEEIGQATFKFSKGNLKGETTITGTIKELKEYKNYFLVGGYEFE